MYVCTYKLYVLCFLAFSELCDVCYTQERVPRLKDTATQTERVSETRGDDGERGGNPSERTNSSLQRKTHVRMCVCYDIICVCTYVRMYMQSGLTYPHTSVLD